MTARAEPGGPAAPSVRRRVRRGLAAASAVLRHRRLQGPLRVAAASSWLGLAILPLAAGRAPAPADNISGILVSLAFGIAALVTRLAFRFIRSRWQLLAFAAAAALLQMGSLWALPGRDGARHWLLAIAGAVVGAALGIGIGRAIDHLTWRMRSHG